MSLSVPRAAIPQPVRTWLREQKQLISGARKYPGLTLSRLPLIGEMIAAILPARRPPVLLVSLPRGGSSWVGGILGSSEGSLYLREPVTQAYLKRFGQKAPPFFEWTMSRDRRSYDRFAGHAFAGIPRFGPTMVPLPDQWSLSERRRRRVVIKEVNPLLLDRCRARFDPRIVLLVRHPAPVARSFHTLGWVGDQLRTRFSPATLAAFASEHPLPGPDDYWGQAGACHAIAQRIALAALRGTGHLVVRYEDVCTDPLSEFGRMFDFCGLPFTGAVREEIERSARSPADYTPGSYDTRRNSRDMADRWKREMAAEEIAGVRRGYLACRPVYYQAESDW